MKILYDHQTFTLQKYGGISRYFYEMIKYLSSNNNNIEISLYFSNNHYISDNKTIKHFKFLNQYEFRGKQRLNMLLNKIYSIYILKKQRFDIFHPTYYDTYFLDYIKDKPFVVTVYDMIHEKFKDNFAENDTTSQNKKILCQKADKIIAISQSTKNDLIDIFDIEASKIEVVYLANSLVIKDEILDDDKLPKKYILFVGSRGVYKNFNRFIKAIFTILNEDKDLSIICVGGDKFNSNETNLFNELNIAKQVYQYTLDDDKLSSFYKQAELFIFPSLYEGFGIPVLEAFACDCPLVCSNTSSLPEIAVDGAEYFDPYDVFSIKTAIENVLNNDDRKKVLKLNGKKRLKNFSWQKTAEDIKRLYESIAK
jgi:glycosyltransferase involved in cell wall biosynthesis